MKSRFTIAGSLPQNKAITARRRIRFEPSGFHWNAAIAVNRGKLNRR
jgi:hypothetical protein